MLPSLRKFYLIMLLTLAVFTANPMIHLTQASSQAGQAHSNSIFVPFIEVTPSYSISGRIVDKLGYGLPGVTVTLSSGQTTLSDSQGDYIFDSLPEGSYTYAASDGDQTFSPLFRSAVLPSSLFGKNFTSLATSKVSLNMDAFYHSQRSETRLANACGPAALLTNLEYFGVNAGSLNQVILTLSLPPKSGGYDPNCILNPVCLSAGTLASVAQNSYNLSVDAHENWNFDFLYSSIARGKPVIALVTLGLEANGIGHFVTVYGADPLKQIITYHDPFYGPARTAPWKTFFASWSGPVDVYDPLKPAGHRAWGMDLSR